MTTALFLLMSAADAVQRVPPGSVSDELATGIAKALLPVVKNVIALPANDAE
jgi:hypothetical protein